MININNKEWDKLTASDIVEFLDTLEDETFFFELKSDAESNEKLMKEVSAFANTYGGYIFLGIENDKTISGCQKWTEERVHTTMYNGISPIPIFDVKRFLIKGKTVIIIKIEEGALPPYITTKGGKIYERISSGSYPIKDSAKLTQLYNKKSDQLRKIHGIIDIEEIKPDKREMPINLCAYIDFGFFLTTSRPTYLSRNFFSIDLNRVVDYLKRHASKYSISRYGQSLVICLGEVKAINPHNSVLLGAGIDSFIEIHIDGSAKGRILLISDPGTNNVDIKVLTTMIRFKEIYSLLLGDNLDEIFISAHRYEKTSVIRKFKPYYGSYNSYNNLAKYSLEQKQKYGEILITNDNRVPKNDFTYFDKRFFDTHGIVFNIENLLDQLFALSFMNLGFIDVPVLVEQS